MRSMYCRTSPTAAPVASVCATEAGSCEAFWRSKEIAKADGVNASIVTLMAADGKTELYGKLKLPEKLPPEAEVNLPQPQWMTLLPFGLLLLFLLAVGSGWLLRGNPEPNGTNPPPATGSAPNERLE